MACFKLNRRTSTKGHFEDESVGGLKPDPFVGSERVVGLSVDNFEQYLKSKDIAMVMFYATQDAASRWSGKHFKKAAKSTIRPGHGFAAIDCEKDSDICVEEGITDFPHFKLYTKGEDVGFSSDSRKLAYSDMKVWVEGFPLPA